ncbi:unnamed protein product [Plutella xylostella]|uniref:(diamondback moth) hypothetical protein n=1 Tax=Plutella xylostella TaxID=51655 RepID=A0A8S4G041_PLUXY|nr:unnamed protein product [Plutella xylostella]
MCQKSYDFETVGRLYFGGCDVNRTTIQECLLPTHFPAGRGVAPGSAYPTATTAPGSFSSARRTSRPSAAHRMGRRIMTSYTSHHRTMRSFTSRHRTMARHIMDRLIMDPPIMGRRTMVRPIMVRHIMDHHIMVLITSDP